MGDCQAHAAMGGESAVAKLVFGTRNISPLPEAHTLAGWTWQQSRLNGRGVVPVPTATEATGTACSERRAGRAGPAPALVDDPVFGLYAYDGTPGNLPNGIQVRPSDGLNIRFFNPTDRCELIDGGSGRQPNEYWNLQHLTRGNRPGSDGPDGGAGLARCGSRVP